MCLADSIEGLSSTCMVSWSAGVFSWSFCVTLNNLLKYLRHNFCPGKISKFCISNSLYSSNVTSCNVVLTVTWWLANGSAHFFICLEYSWRNWRNWWWLQTSTTSSRFSILALILKSSNPCIAISSTSVFGNFLSLPLWQLAYKIFPMEQL